MATTLIALSYHYYAASSGCHLNLAFISLTLIAGVFMTAVLFVPNRVASAGLLTSNTIFLYCSYLLFSALNSEEASECTRGGGTSGSWLQARMLGRLAQWLLAEGRANVPRCFLVTTPLVTSGSVST